MSLFHGQFSYATLSAQDRTKHDGGANPAEAQGDHIIPKSKRGDGATVKDQRNIETKCAACNNKKSDKIE